MNYISLSKISEGVHFSSFHDLLILIYLQEESQWRWEFSNITDEETSRPYRQHLSYSTSYIVFDSEDVEYTSSIRTSTSPSC